MKCPHCSLKISVFGKDANKLVKTKFRACSSCGGKFKMVLSYSKFFAIAFPLGFIFSLFLKGELIFIGIGAGAGIAAMLSMRAIRAED